jgi:hypothetical protein
MVEVAFSEGKAIFHGPRKVYMEGPMQNSIEIAKSVRARLEPCPDTSYRLKVILQVTLDFENALNSRGHPETHQAQLDAFPDGLSGSLQIKFRRFGATV